MASSEWVWRPARGSGVARGVPRWLRRCSRRRADRGRRRYRPLPFLVPVDDSGQDRQEHDNDNDKLDVLVDPRNVAAQEIPGEEHAPDPEQPARHIIEDEAPVLHLADAGHDRGKSPDDRHETRNDDGLATVALVEVLGPVQVALVEQQRILAGKDARAAGPADRITE